MRNPVISEAHHALTRLLTGASCRAWSVMRVSLVLAILLCSVSLASATVLPGIDVLEQQRFNLLQGKRLGLITNHTGRSRDGRSTIDILHHAAGVNLVALYSPEHGIRGEADENVSSGIDAKSGFPVHSLYGTTCRPTAEMLRGVEMLAFDVQDIGTRFYTYIGTLSLAMRAAKEAGIPFVVFDRPNPINGVAVGGAIPTVSLQEKKSGCGAITSIHPIPTRHGMTVGELARLFNAEFGIGCDLHVISMEGWRRGMYFDETGLSWINPSPNMKSLTAALLYPGAGTLETSNISVGRGTLRPFEMYGAPWVDAAALVANLKQRAIPGLCIAAISFVPTTAGYPYRGQNCYGVSFTISDRELFDPILAGLHLAQAMYEVHPQQFNVYEGFATEIGDTDIRMLLRVGGRRPVDIVRSWGGKLTKFGEMRQKYLLYGII